MKAGLCGSQVFPDSAVAIMLFYLLNEDREIVLGIVQTKQQTGETFQKKIKGHNYE